MGGCAKIANSNDMANFFSLTDAFVPTSRRPIHRIPHILRQTEPNTAFLSATPPTTASGTSTQKHTADRLSSVLAQILTHISRNTLRNGNCCPTTADNLRQTETLLSDFQEVFHYDRKKKRIFVVQNFCRI